MKSLKCSWKDGLIALACFALGAALFHSSPAKARTVIYAQHSHLELEITTPTTLYVAGDQVVGFSCVPNPNGGAECYTVSR
jgi:hypothetical protein